MRRWLALALLALPAAAAAQEDDPRFCPTRPSLGGSSCTTEPGRVHMEMSLIDWQREDHGDGRDDRIITADLLTRFGIGSKTEVQLGFDAFGHDRERTPSGSVDRLDDVGDVTIALRQHLAGEEGKRFSAGIQPFVTLAVGKAPVGAGDWGAGMIVPVQYDLTKKLAVQFTAEGDAAVNESGQGRHLAYSGIGGLRYKLTDMVNLVAELDLERDDDPMGHETHALAAWSVAWRPTKRFQLDTQVIAGLNSHSPNFRLVAGGAALF